MLEKRREVQPEEFATAGLWARLILLAIAAILCVVTWISAIVGGNL